MTPPHPITELARWASGRPGVGVRYVTPKQAKQKNIPNALVDPRFRGGKIRGPEQFMYIPQSTFQAFESLTKDTGVVWPEKTQAIALMTVLHEARHLRGGPKWTSEVRAQDRALNLYKQAARRLGLPPDKTERMFDIVLKYTQSLPPDYRPKNR